VGKRCGHDSHLRGSARGVSCEDTCAICLGAARRRRQGSRAARPDPPRVEESARGGRNLLKESACLRGDSCEVTGAAGASRGDERSERRGGGSDRWRAASSCRSAEVAPKGPAQECSGRRRRTGAERVTCDVLASVVDKAATLSAPSAAREPRRSSDRSPSPSAHAFGVLPFVGATGQCWTCPGRRQSVADFAVTLKTCRSSAGLCDGDRARTAQPPARRDSNAVRKGSTELR